jgi:hypothetical protein
MLPGGVMHGVHALSRNAVNRVARAGGACAAIGSGALLLAVLPPAGTAAARPVAAARPAARPPGRPAA